MSGPARDESFIPAHGHPRGAEGCLLSQVTVGERILVHLGSFLRFSDAFECPRDTTQEGISRALGISRAHAALELKRLKASAKVEERMAHVAGARTRRKVYFLTSSGAALGRALRDHARGKTVLLADGAERREARGDEAIESLKARGLREGEATQVVLASDLVDLRRRHRPGERDLPTAEPFVDRDAELAALRDWLASPAPLALVLGVAGVGKTALAVRAAAGFAGPVWYRKAYGFEDARAFASGLADFLDGASRPRLRHYLANGGFDPVDLGRILREDLAGVLVIADDVHASPEVAGFLRLVVDAGPAGKVLATARERPEGLVAGRAPPATVVLGGLPPDAARALATSLLGDRPDRVDAVVAAGRGHPMALRLLATGPPAAGAADADRVLEDAVLDGLDSELERAALLLAVLRKPAERPGDLGIAASSLRRLTRRGLIVPAPGGVALHDLARDVLLPKAPPAAVHAAHRAAARGAGRRGDTIEAAFHFAEAGEGARARDLLVARGPDLVDSPTVGELARLLQRLPSGPEAALLLAEALDRLGRGTEAAALLEPLRDDPASPRRAEAILLMGRIASRRNALGEATALLESAVAAAATSGDAGLEGAARRVLALVHRKAGDLDRAEAELDRAIPLLSGADRARDRVRARLDRATLRLQRGDDTAAAAELESLLADPARGPREEAAILSNLAIARSRAGRAAEAAALLEASARAAERGGDSRAAGYALANAADAYLGAGRVDAAEASVRRARDVARGFADPLLESTVLTNEGKVLAALGRAGPAEERLREGVERIRHAGNVLSLIERVRELAEFYDSVGRPDEARRWRQESEGLRRGTDRGTPSPAPP